ncbi:MAG: L-2-hydroxyglutarate oxidase [Crocinitomicaceae bacterium]|nr:L-2-hydroxyglutarate oxidase [Crocinitomicaceae bacterium]|tara:strand:+ start:50703 stop:51920 length:1218 start_codon:yes stop_codon:yes gene_type:complete
MTYDFCVVGGGIVGLATAYKLQCKFPDQNILVLEKENRFAPHQSGNNSGVIHSGIYYKPGYYKAKNCVDGRRELVAFAKEHNIAHDICGKIIVATNESELPFLAQIHQNGIENGVEDIEEIGPDRIKEIEPHCEGIKGLRVGCTGIIDYVGATDKLAELLEGLNPNSKALINHEVLGIKKQNGISVIETNNGDFKSARMIFCAGLQADRLARKDGVNIKEKVVGFRGDYYELTEQGKHKVKHLIYPVPNPEFPFLGVHFTRMTNGEIECGPNAVFTFKREGYGKTDFDLKDTIDALTYGGTWKLFFKNISFGINEYRRAFSKKLFLKTLQRLIPSLTMEDLKPGRAGVRAMLLSTNGDTKDDFRIEYKDNSIHVLNAPSPAATACLAIGNEVVNMATKHFKLESK